MADKQVAQNFLTNVIRPTLQTLDLWSAAAEELLLGTAITESHLRYRRQIGGGPARSYFQMEINTHNDIWDNFLAYRRELRTKIQSFLPSSAADKLHELEHNDQYACAMARAHYLRQPAALPVAGDTNAMGQYWKTYYNTELGAGTVAKYLRDWNDTFAGTGPR